MADHISHIPISERLVEDEHDELPDTILFQVDYMLVWTQDIVEFFIPRQVPTNLSKSKKRALITKFAPYIFIVGQLYKTGTIGIIK